MKIYYISRDADWDENEWAVVIARDEHHARQLVWKQHWPNCEYKHEWLDSKYATVTKIDPNDPKVIQISFKRG